MRKLRVTRHEVTQPQNESYRYIPLTRGLNAIVDKDDFERLSQWNWYAMKTKAGFYAARGIYFKRSRKIKVVYMHQIILKCPPGKETDHVNRNGLDNRKENLRPCTPQQNNRNRGQPKGTFRLRNGRWRASIKISKKKNIHIGCFRTAAEAENAYREASLKYHGEFSPFNQSQLS